MARSKNVMTTRTMLGAGLAAGATVGALVSATRSGQRKIGTPTLINWQRARQVAALLNRDDPFANQPKAEFTRYYAQLVKQAAPLVAEAIGSKVAVPSLQVAAVSRAQWVAANIHSFRNLFDPIDQFHLESLQQSGAAGSLPNLVVGSLNQLVLSAELGTLLGYLSKHVLGQYDISLLGAEADRGKLFFVEPNIAATQQQLGLDADDFRLWIALHEVTHAYQFEAHPWLRPYFNGLLGEYFDHLKGDLGAMRDSGFSLGNIIGRVREGRDEGRGWLEAVMTPPQRDLFQRMQSLMTMVEGYGNYVMNSVGARLLPSYEFIHERVEHRQGNRRVVERLFMRVTGMALKMEQYALGEAFINHVVESRGPAFAPRIWRGPDYIPTTAELKDHEAWIARVEKLG